MPQHKGIYCSIHTGVDPLPEYPADTTTDSLETGTSDICEILQRDDTPKTFIEISGTDGLPFHIKVRSSPEFEWDRSLYTRIVMGVRVDGIFISSLSFSNFTTPIEISGPHYSQINNGEVQAYRKPMHFKKLSVGIFPLVSISNHIC